MRLLSFLLFVSIMAKGQGSDSLLQSILALDNDTQQVNLLYQRGFVLRNNDPLKAFEYAQLCEQAAKRSGSELHEAKAFNLLGLLTYKKGQLTKALNYHQKALAIRLAHHDFLGIALSETNLGNVYSDLSLYQKAENSYLKALTLYKQLHDEIREADCLINLGVLKQNLEQNDEAAENYLMAYQVADAKNDYERKTLCLNNLAVIYQEAGQFEKAIACNEDALKLRRIMDNRLEEADSYLNLASVYMDMKDFSKAITELDTAYFIARQFEYFEAQLSAYELYAKYYVGTKNFEKAYLWLQKSESCKDSLRAMQAEVNFAEAEQLNAENAVVSETGALHNKGLLICIFILFIGIPFTLIHYKR